MRLGLRCLALLILAFTVPSRAGGPLWYTNVEAAQKAALEEDKFLLLNFTEPDFCGDCVKMKQEIWTQPEFLAFAGENLVLVELSFPHDRPPDPVALKIRERLAQVMQIDSFPTVVVLNKQGKYMAHGKYAPGGPRAYIADLERIPGMRHVDVDRAMARMETAATEKPVEFVPIAPSTTPRYNQIALKAISGAKDHRLALINNETLGVGETAKIKFLDEKVDVCCKEIRDDSVLVTINGKLTELKLGGAAK